MGTNNQQRRAAKKRKTATSQRSRHDGGNPRRSAPTPSDGIGSRSATVNSELVEQLFYSGAQASAGGVANPQAVAHVCRALADITTEAESSTARAERIARPDQVGESLIVRLVRNLWERGWRPVDLAHVVRRRTNARLLRLFASLLDAEAAASGAADRAPAEWVDQLRSIGATLIARAPGSDPISAPAITRWRRAEWLDLDEAYELCLTLIGILITLRPLVALEPPPSAWGATDGPAWAGSTRTGAGRPGSCRPGSTRPGSTRPGSAHDVSGVNAKMLSTVRALLAKAERSEFPAEAEAFTAKAQDLMTRHSIDAAVLAAADVGGAGDLHTEVRTRRVHIDDPYAPEKAQLLSAVSQANSVRAVFLADVAMSSIVGFPFDLDLVELLYTSLLIQATRAMGDASAAGGRSRSPAYRRAFFMSYATRIGERLQEAREHAGAEAAGTYGSSLVPILARRTQAVNDRFDEWFPGSRPGRSRMVDGRGWEAGRLAADMANLASGRTTLAK